MGASHGEKNNVYTYMRTHAHLRKHPKTIHCSHALIKKVASQYPHPPLPTQSCLYWEFNSFNKQYLQRPKNVWNLKPPCTLSLSFHLSSFNKKRVLLSYTHTYDIYTLYTYIFICIDMYGSVNKSFVPKLPFPLSPHVCCNHRFVTSFLSKTLISLASTQLSLYLFLALHHNTTTPIIYVIYVYTYVYIYMNIHV